MNLIDYTGKLNSHDEYINIINKLEKKCLYVEIVVLDKRKSNELVEKLKNTIISTKKVSKWWGTETVVENNLFKIKPSDKLFRLLREYETFCKYFISNNGIEDRVELTDFGIDDIAFYDDKNMPLLFSTTHEGFITIRDDLIN